MARKRKKRNASRGSVNNIILKTLVNGDKYGYEIIKEVEQYSNGKILLKQPSLYSSLSRFEEKSFVTSYWGDSDIGGRRHYYHLTDLGLDYYKKFVLKEADDLDDSEDKNPNENFDSDNQLFTNVAHEEDLFEQNDKSISSLDIDEDNFDDNSEDETDELISESFTPIDEDEIPAIVNFEINNSQNQEIIPDHVFHSPTPIESMIESEQTTSIDSYHNSFENSSNIPYNSQNIENDFVENVDETDTEKERWLNLTENSKKSNKKFSNTNYNVLYFKKPKKEQKIVRDVDGIFKLRDEDYVPQNKSKPIIIDNVIKRTKNTNLFDYDLETNREKDKQKINNDFSEISQEEKLKRNENFLAKFNLLTMSKMKPVSAPAPKPIEKKPEPTIDYRSKLDAIFDTNLIDDEVEEDQIVFDGQVEQNNLFSYPKQDEWQTSFVDNNETTTEDVDDNELINFEASEQFELKQDNRQYLEEINNHVTPPSQVNMSRYEHTTKAVLLDKTYLLNNKLKFVFGIIMTLFMIAEVALSWFLFKNSNLVVDNDKTILIIACVIVGIFAMSTILPFIFNSNSHKANNFKFKYSFWFGILTFIVLAILIYCINALNGFELDNLEYFAVKLFMPLILAFNFVLSPIVYGLLIKSKSFYD